MALLAVATASVGAASQEPQTPPPVPLPKVVTSSADQDAKRMLAAAANNPVSPVPQVFVRSIIARSLVGSSGGAWSVEVDPAAPIFLTSRLPQLLKLTVPAFVSTTAPQTASGFGDMEFMDLMAIRLHKMAIGIGATAVFPTASESALGEGKWQVGPTAGLIFFGIENFILGALLQNPISFAGDATRPDTNTLAVAPTATYNFQHGWFAGLSDLEWEFDWKNADNNLVPLGLQGGRVVSIGPQTVSLSIEGAYAIVHPAQTPYPRWQVAVEMTFLFPELLRRAAARGPKEKQ
jgi:hypothetical protein